MIQKTLKDIKPFIDFVYDLIEKVEEKEQELEDVRKIARDQKEYAERLLENEQKLRIENHTLQLFIEENVSEEKKKEIFKD